MLRVAPAEMRRYAQESETLRMRDPSCRGRTGIDVGHEVQEACRGAAHLVNPAASKIVADNDNYALAA